MFRLHFQIGRFETERTEVPKQTYLLYYSTGPLCPAQTAVMILRLLGPEGLWAAEAGDPNTSASCACTAAGYSEASKCALTMLFSFAKARQASASFCRRSRHAISAARPKCASPIPLAAAASSAATAGLTSHWWASSKEDSTTSGESASSSSSPV